MPSSLVSRIRITRLREGRVHPKQEFYAPDRFGNAGCSENAVRVVCGSCALSDGRLTTVCDRRIYRLFGLTECQLLKCCPGLPTGGSGTRLATGLPSSGHSRGTVHLPRFPTPQRGDVVLF